MTDANNDSQIIFEENDSLPPEDKYIVDSQDARILKNILHETNLAAQFASSFDDSIFCSSTASKIATAVLSYFKLYKIPPTQKILLEKVKDFPNLFEEFSFGLSEIEKQNVDPKEFKYDLDKLKTNSVIRQARKLSSKITSSKIVSSEDATALLQEIKQTQVEIERLQNPHSEINNRVSLKNYLSTFKREYNERFHNPEIGRGIPTKFKMLDHFMNGLSKADFLIIAGSTGGGKSILKQAIANQVYLQDNKITTREHFSKGYNVLYFSLEMPYQQCIYRGFSAIADIPFYGIRDAKLQPAEMKALQTLAEFIEAYPYHYEVIDIPRGCTVDDIEREFLETCDTFIPDVVFVDYLGLMEEKNFSGDDWLKLGYISGRLHEFARKYDIPVVTSTQLNRNDKAQEKDIVGINRIGRSSMVLHHATAAVQIESRPDEKTYSDMIGHLIKNRNGALGQFNLNKNLSHCRVWDPDHIILPDTESVLYSPSDKSNISGLLTSFGWNLV